MDVFTGISRNTTSTRFFQTLFNNLVIFPREPDQELNHGLGKFWSLTLFDEIPEFLTNFGFVARRWFVARSCVQFFCHGNLPCVDGYLNKRVACCVVFYYFCCLVLLVLLAPVVFCVYGYLDMLISIITALPSFSCFAFLIRIITAQRCQHCFVWKSWSALRGKILLQFLLNGFRNCGIKDFWLAIRIAHLLVLKGINEWGSVCPALLLSTRVSQASCLLFLLNSLLDSTKQNFFSWSSSSSLSCWKSL